MTLNIHERDIEPQLCRACGACCQITFKLRDTNSRYRRFLRQIGYTLLPVCASGQTDCCDKKHDVTVNMGYCKHLDIEHHGGREEYRCRIYQTDDLPELCAQFNCVGWAKANDTYAPGNVLLEKAQKALDRLRGKCN
jgi:Fe-S-cluster containining protein